MHVPPPLPLSLKLLEIKPTSCSLDNVWECDCKAGTVGHKVPTFWKNHRGCHVWKVTTKFNMNRRGCKLCFEAYTLHWPGDELQCCLLMAALHNSYLFVASICSLQTCYVGDNAMLGKPIFILDFLCQDRYSVRYQNQPQILVTSCHQPHQ